MSDRIQTVYETYQQVGWPGMPSRPEERCWIDYLPAQVPTSGRNPRPGDGVYWDATNNGAAVAASDANELQVFGIVTYEQGIVQSELTTTPTGSNSAYYVEYEDGEYMPVMRWGSIFVIAGGACEYLDLMRYQNDDFKWDQDNPGTTVADMFRSNIECVSISGADNGIIEVRINGRGPRT